ncbi:MAG: lysophospholipid acyltransferase family protein [Variibacter sp.]|nr:lysophospholipid acyltransferase family protein [Variibacter sp.]
MAFERIRDAQWFRQGAGALMARYLTFVWKTSRFELDPADLYERLAPELPVIITLWHGQHFLGPFMRRPEHRAKALISMHRDAEVNAIAVERLGMGVIRGSGDHEGRFDRKGGVRAFIAMREALEQGWNMVVTADVPKVARVAGRGVVMLARSSGRPIFPVGLATSRRIVLRNWDRSAINLPFSRGAIVLGDPVRVPATADDDTLEACRRQLEASLNAATERAYRIVDCAGENAKGA